MNVGFKYFTLCPGMISFAMRPSEDASCKVKTSDSADAKFKLSQEAPNEEETVVNLT